MVYILLHVDVMQHAGISLKLVTRTRIDAPASPEKYSSETFYKTTLCFKCCDVDFLFEEAVLVSILAPPLLLLTARKESFMKTAS
jgi:hypothetical protein